MGSHNPPSHHPSTPKDTARLPLPWRRTPLVESAVLSRAAGCRIFLKLENLQPSSAFKSRGIGNLILSAVRRAAASQSSDQIDANAAATSLSLPPPKLHFYCSSGGNAGLAAVMAAASLGYPCSVALPTSADASILAKLKAAGANEVLVHGDSWADADRYLREVVMPEAEKRLGKGSAIYVPPFDHEDVWRGAETLVDEVAEQLETRPDALVCSVGGGGLLVGCVQGVERMGWGGEQGTRVVAVETVGAESLNRSLVEGRLVTLPGITSVAKSLGAVKVAARAFEVAQWPNVVSEVLSDAEACMGCWRFADDERFLVEPACGVSVALAYEPERLRKLVPGFSGDSKVVIVVCGGSRIDLDTIQKYREEYGPEIEKMGLGGKGVGRQDVPSTYTVQ